ncbi:hypothetical protein CA54_02940 [Symmachiella macrocystis]|uniref:Uncharacterized protein n=1 Tax=Symmachiella macrocystis TaxID=2527985 RepID=A0A5C6BIG8_9PLAN|nr:hypothetical protein [Symmachiella macrocystis]TWU11487.1 hypothetical protein CA54_02940 [Symmachiella macrocystis]
MSPRSSSSRRTKKKPQGPPPEADIYVALLFVSVAALITGIGFLWVELDAYGFTSP